MVCTAGTVIELMRKLAPEDTAEPYDAAGLQIGSRGRPVSRLLLALEVTGAVAGEARERGTDMIVTHHPLFFGALSRLDEDAPAGRLAARLIRMGITVYSAHTNLDRAAGGVNDRLAEALGAVDVGVPEGQPYIRTGTLARPMGPDEFIAHVAGRLGAAAVRTAGKPPAWVRRIAVGGGASGDRLDVVAGAGVDAFVAGEMKYHQAREAEERGVFAVIAGHFETEWPVMPFLEKYLQNALHDLQYDVEIKLSDVNRSPFRPV